MEKILRQAPRGHHGCGWDDNDGRRGEPSCDGPPPWRWSSFSIAAIWTHLVALWTHLAAAWSVCRRRRLLTLNSKVPLGPFPISALFRWCPVLPFLTGLLRADSAGHVRAGCVCALAAPCVCSCLVCLSM